MSATARLIEDGGAAAAEEQFFRSPQFLEAEGTTHTLIVERGTDLVAIPLVVREIEGADGARDATSPYSYPGGRVEGDPISPADVDWAATGLVSVFVRDRLGEPTALAGARDRSLVLVHDPGRPRKSRMSDRQQIRKNAEVGYALEDLPGPATTPAERGEFHRVYTETMQKVGASSRYLFDSSYFDLLFSAPLSRLFRCLGPAGDLAAAAIVVESDGFLHYYLSGTADEHRRRAPSKNLIGAVSDHADERGLPMNLGGGVEPGDGLEEFKRGFANRELPFRTHEIICDPQLYEELTEDEGGGDFFPGYRVA